MNFMPRFKILQILILIAAIGFGARFSDFVKDVASMSKVTTPAQAAEAPMADVEMEELGPPPSADEDSDGALVEPAMKFNENSEKIEIATEVTAEAPEWRDSLDEDYEGSEINMQLFEDLAERRKALEMQERELSMREALLTAAEQEINQKFQELTSIKGEIEELLATQSEEEIARTASLVKIYEGMKPKDAARIFNTLDKDVLLQVVSEMSERKSAPVLASMEPEKARQLTMMLMEKKSLSGITANILTQQ